LTEATRPSEPPLPVKQDVVYDGRIIRVLVETFEAGDGTLRRREVVAHPGAVAIAARRSNGEILLVRQERLAVRRDLWEIPAGTLEPNEAPLDCAKRELREETGFEAENWRVVMRFFTSPGFCNEEITLFVAEGLCEVGSYDPDEISECRGCPLDRLVEMIAAGEIVDATTIVAVQALRAETGSETP